VPEPAPSGPAADYPVTVGEPFTIGATTWTPADQLNYDAVGQATVQQSLTGVSAAHKTLPLPSYAEVTSLASGRTILVRLVERGPMENATLLALSPEGAAQLGVDGKAAVRVRRVNPPEVERAALRTGGRVPQRMDTPESLLKVLRRKLAEQSPLLPPPSVPPRMPAGLPPTLATAKALPGQPEPAASAAAKPTPTPRPAPKPAAAPAPKPQDEPRKAPAPKAITAGSTIVQVAAFSTAERAKSAASKLGGQVAQAGRLWRVRLGPFASREEASAALGKAKAAGYSDARIQRAD
jgi:rare lipoprotein A